MTKEQYERWSAPIARHPNGPAALNRVNFLLTRLCYVCYPLSLLLLALQRDGRFWRVLLVPGVSFVLISLLRRGINRPRPYETLDIHPLIHKDTHGKSFPSRHVFSVFVIDMAFWYLCPPLGGVFLAVGLVLAAVRVLGGVHYPSDVLAGALMAAAAGAVGFWVV